MENSRTSTSTLLVILPLASFLFLLLPPISGLKCIYCGGARGTHKGPTDGFTPEENSTFYYPQPCGTLSNATDPIDPRFAMDCDHFAAVLQLRMKKMFCSWKKKDGSRKCDFSQSQCTQLQRTTPCAPDSKACFCDDKDFCNGGQHPGWVLPPPSRSGNECESRSTREVVHTQFGTGTLEGSSPGGVLILVGMWMCLLLLQQFGPF